MPSLFGRTTRRSPYAPLVMGGLLVCLALAAWPLATEAQDVSQGIQEAKDAAAKASAKINQLWVLICASIVFFMQAGFLCLEVGSVRPRAATITALKNVIDWTSCAIAFYFVGWGLMFGHSGAGGLFGIDGWMLSYPAAQIAEGNAVGVGVHFLFQVVFAGTAATIVSGALAERTSFYAYFLFSIVITGLIYPVAGHWCWGNSFFGSNASESLLVKMGFIDFAGSTMVHSIGGWASLIGIITVGARLGRFGPKGEVRDWDLTGIHWVALSVLMLWFSWWGFNGGSTLMWTADNYGAVNDVTTIIINTNLGAATGGLGALLYTKFFKQSKGISLNFLGGILAGLVGITASCHMVTSLSACLIGLTSGAIMCIIADMLLAFRLDDPVAAVPVHLGCGIWGTLCVGIFGKEEVIKLSAGDRMSQIGVQMLGIGLVAFWVVGVSMIVFWALKRWVGLRVSPEEEQYGFDIAGAAGAPAAEMPSESDLRRLFAAEGK